MVKSVRVRRDSIQVRRKNFKSKIATLTYRLLSTGEEKRKVVNLGALSGYVKSFDSHPNCEVFFIEVPHGYVQQTKDFLRRLKNA